MSVERMENGVPADDILGAESMLGRTAFEALATDSSTEVQGADEYAGLENSVTRIPGGQTVPDE